MLKGEQIRITIEKLATGEKVQTIDTVSTGYDIVYTQNDRGGEPIYINNLHNCDLGKKHIKTYEFREEIEEIHKELSEYLQNFVPRKIRVMVDEEWEKTDQSKPNSCWKAKIKKASNDYNAQTGIEYVIDLRRYYLENWTDAQIVACLFGLLSRIQEDGSIRQSQMDDADPLVYTFGANYLDSGMVIPHMVKDKVCLKHLPKANKMQQEMKINENNEMVIEEGPQDDEPEADGPGALVQ